MSNISRYFSKMSLVDCANANYGALAKAGMPEEKIGKLRIVCKIPKLDYKKAYCFLVEEDPLTKDLYEPIETDDVLKFKFGFINAAIPDNIKEVIGPLGIQTSKYHAEDLLQHVSIVAADLVDSGMSVERAIKLALYHDIGKKYTTATNKIGEICFYNHAQISSFILSQWLRDEDRDESRILIAAVYAHMYPMADWAVEKDWRTGVPVFYRKDFYNDLLLNYCDYDSDMANEIMSVIDTLAKVDVGVHSIDEKVKEKIARGQKLILGDSI